MIIEPRRSPAKFRPVALLTPGYRALRAQTLDGDHLAYGEDDCFALLERLAGHVLYTDSSVAELRGTTDARRWSAMVRGGKASTMALDDTSVVVKTLRGTLEDAAEPFEALLTALEWLAGYGVAPASISSMGWALWRSTLTDPITLDSPPRVGRGALYGGRKGIRERRTYQHMVGADICCAYPHSMAARPYAARLVKVANTTTLDPEAAGIIVGAIGIPPELPYGPVPWRPIEEGEWLMFPTGKTVNGAWTWAEALYAESLGCTVLVDECYAPATERDLFAPWWPIAYEGRKLPGPAGQIVKAATNSLWGCFAMRGDNREILRWDDDAGLRPVRVKLADQRLPHAAAAHIAAETTARVRVRVLSEGCYERGIGPGSPVFIDTDGIIIRKRAAAGMSRVAVPGAWRVKTPMRKVEIRSAGVYRYLCGAGCGIDHRRWHYSASGVRKGDAEAVFEGKRGGIPWAFGGDRALAMSERERRELVLKEKRRPKVA